MSSQSNTTINVDTPDFLNPFEKHHNDVEGRLLYTSYIAKQFNQQLLKKIGDNDIFSDEKNEIWTRAECLQSLACLFGYRNILTEVHRDILTNPFGIIVHQVNCQGVMGAGLAKSIKEKWPIVYEKYKALRVMQPGIIQLVRVNLATEKYPLYVCNLFGQNEYGSFKRFTEYYSVRRALKQLRKVRIGKELDLPVYFPYKIGCNRGGGDWNKYSKLILKYCPDAIICKID